jgi:excisionase family DNA binding protein
VGLENIDQAEDEILDYSAAEKVTGISKSTLYQLVHQKRIPHLKIGSRFIRFHKSKIVEWLKSHEVSVCAPKSQNMKIGR